MGLTLRRRRSGQLRRRRGAGAAPPPVRHLRGSGTASSSVAACPRRWSGRGARRHASSGNRGHRRRISAYPAPCPRPAAGRWQSRRTGVAVRARPGRAARVSCGAGRSPRGWTDRWFPVPSAAARSCRSRSDGRRGPLMFVDQTRPHRSGARGAPRTRDEQVTLEDLAIPLGEQLLLAGDLLGELLGEPQHGERAGIGSDLDDGDVVDIRQTRVVSVPSSSRSWRKARSGRCRPPRHVTSSVAAMTATPAPPSSAGGAGSTLTSTTRRCGGARRAAPRPRSPPTRARPPRRQPRTVLRAATAARHPTVLFCSVRLRSVAPPARP